MNLPIVALLILTTSLLLAHAAFVVATSERRRRDMFAAHAMQGQLAHGLDPKSRHNITDEHIARNAYDYADAMQSARQARKTTVTLAQAQAELRAILERSDATQRNERAQAAVESTAPIALASTVALALAFGLTILACTTQETADWKTAAADAARCIGAHADEPHATPQGVAFSCGVSEVPDLVRLIEDVIAARNAAALDAGAQ